MPLLSLWAFVACYRVKFTLTFTGRPNLPSATISNKNSTWTDLGSTPVHLKPLQCTIYFIKSSFHTSQRAVYISIIRTKQMLFVVTSYETQYCPHPPYLHKHSFSSGTLLEDVRETPGILTLHEGRCACIR